MPMANRTRSTFSLRPERGFTLIEILVAVLVLSVLVAALVYRWAAIRMNRT